MRYTSKSFASSKCPFQKFPIQCNKMKKVYDVRMDKLGTQLLVQFYFRIIYVTVMAHKNIFLQRASIIYQYVTFNYEEKWFSGVSVSITYDQFDVLLWPGCSHQTSIMANYQITIIVFYVEKLQLIFRNGKMCIIVVSVISIHQRFHHKKKHELHLHIPQSEGCYEMN